MSETEIASADLSTLIITLLKGVIYQDSEAKLWRDLLELQVRVRDYIVTLGLELVLDEAEGYAFLKSKTVTDDEAAAPKRLISRRQLSFPVSLMLALLRKKLAEFDASGGDTRLVLSLDDASELIRVFLPDNNNQAKLLDQIETHLNKIADLGFLRKIKSGNHTLYEVRRILKAFVDAQWLAEFDDQLAAYQMQLAGGTSND
ncbi:DUF4194 domain-containing protein [Iodobacter sp. LRB]|uniref:DUF4194 domain-containing protein n=1 Tax=unclassified Iodobacter TaxID=235634 RepID=UPI001C556957|nr:DUF4194 domain-containing protein [Iodobacter sp. BJB302]